MRLIRLLIAFAFLAVGIAVGALNAQPIAIDLGVVTLRGSLCVSLLLALLMGIVVGGVVVSAGMVLPMSRRLRAADRAARDAEPLEPRQR
ncbi:MAG: hypothetical protein JWL98_931 [Xanthomonadaceae bacterium]|nr:hypothetical protein [Xanthomonadaceae bacterium]